AGTVNIELKNASLEDALKQLTSGKPLTYQIIDKTVIIREANAKSAAADITVKGTVKSKEGPGQADLPLPGVVVSVKGTNRATSTDGNGNYTIQAPADGILVFAMLGYGSQEVSISNQKTIDIVLAETASQLQTVIVTAYGSKERKENQIGSAFVVTAKDLERKPQDRIDRLLEGIVPGIQFQVQDGGTSTARPRYQTTIRGEGSFGAAVDPLWVIDGIPLKTGNENNAIIGVNTSVSPLTYLNPEDIESIVVLKDATATSIYGADGSNGVILITTKKGIPGQKKLDYKVNAGISLLNNNRFHVLNADEYRELYTESYRNNTALNQSAMPNLGTANVDWYDLLYRNGLTTSHNLTYSGGNEKTRYYIGAGYYNERPIIIDNKVERFSGRVNVDQKVGKFVDLFLRVGASYNVNEFFSPGDSYYNNRPIDSPYDANGNYVVAAYNSLAIAKLNDDGQKTNAMQGSIGGTARLLPWLTFTSTNGIDWSKITQKEFRSVYTFGERNNGGYGVEGRTRSFNWNSQQRVNFDRTFDKHEVSALIGAEARSLSRRSNNLTGSYFTDDNVRDLRYATKVTIEAPSGEDQTGVSYYGQARYTFNNKYSVLGSFRRDANSDFGSDVRWATFSSIGASWTISNEKFWTIKQIDFAKLKFSYGTNGNSRIGNYKAKGVYTFNLDKGYNGQAGATMTTGENPVLSWEDTKIYNAGLSLGLFKRISLEIEAYQRTTNGLLDETDVTRTTGFTGITQNIGSVRNSGIELTLNTKNIIRKNFEWSTSFNLSHNKNKIIELYNGNDKILDTKIRRVGSDVNTYYLIRWAGVDPRDGSALWYDANGNLTREFDLNNRVALGSGSPDFFGGMTNTFSYKRFTLSSLMVYNVGGYGFSVLQRDAESDGRNLATDNQSANALDRWREPGDLTNLPKSVLGENANFGRNSSRFLHKKTSLRLQNISLNYSFDKQWLSKIKLDRASVYVQADNVGFWTPYSTASDRNDYRNYANPYPLPLLISFGLNVGF
ncbi:MAG: SusC/RagA family TonB-linked outer membrane protein, partial [Pedobacter sp.]|nr:SusC/RagA family TonB-linked outer membrane protein [Pedobacter sp.]